MSTWKDRWGRRPAELVEKVTKALTPTKKPIRSGDRPVRIDEHGQRVITWPDDDLEDLENPRTGGWLGRRPRGWLWRRR